MADATRARADKLLNELVEVVETARTVPMSASCVVPREHVLDLLDALREALPTGAGRRAARPCSPRRAACRSRGIRRANPQRG